MVEVSRSREGAWIEMAVSALTLAVSACRSREGAWIEILPSALRKELDNVAPARERGLKSAGAS